MSPQSQKKKNVTADVPEAYLQTDLTGETVIVKFEWKMAELLKIIDPNTYREYVTI